MDVDNERAAELAEAARFREEPAKTREGYTSSRWIEVPHFAALFLISYLPPRLAYRLARLVGKARYWLDRLGPGKETYPRRVDRLASRPGLTAAGAEAWIRRSHEEEAINEMERFIYPRLTSANLGQYVRFEGLEHVRAALDQGKGVMVYTGHHYGDHTVLHAFGHAGYPGVVVRVVNDRPFYRDPLDRWSFRRQLRVLKQRANWDTLVTNPPSPRTALQVRSLLRDNGVVAILIDARARHPGDVDIEFVDQIAPFPPGSAVIAQAMGTPLVDFWSERTNGGPPLVVRLGTPIYVTNDPVAALREQMARLEAHIRHDLGSWEQLERYNQRRFRGLRGRLAAPPEDSPGDSPTAAIDT